VAVALEPTIPLVLCLLAWPALGIAMAVLRWHGSGPASRRDPVSHLGLVVQALGFGVGFAIPRPSDVPLSLAETLLCWLGVPLAWGSAWIAYQAVRVLGRHWSLEARLLPGHRLVREGPYAWVRHPIYAAMLGLFVGTGVSLTPLPVLLVAVGVYLLGTRLRTRSEERLLRRQFGDEYVRYVREVPALVPWPRSFRRL
jgi:protein-S-isoprenylcysteine O-methyltransferase Ste14